MADDGEGMDIAENPDFTSTSAIGCSTVAHNVTVVSTSSSTSFVPKSKKHRDSMTLIHLLYYCILFIYILLPVLCTYIYI